MPESSKPIFTLLASILIVALLVVAALFIPWKSVEWGKFQLTQPEAREDLRQELERLRVVVDDQGLRLAQVEPDAECRHVAFASLVAPEPSS